MKMLYELEVTEETGFNEDDFPDRFEILRSKGKTPLIFLPVPVQIQDIYNRLNETEEILKKVRRGSIDSDILIGTEVKADIDFYFERYNLISKQQ